MQRDSNYNPLQNQTLFGDVNLVELQENKSSYKKFIMERILENGDYPELYWLIDTYGKGEIAKLIVSKANLSEKTRKFWACQLKMLNSKEWIEFNQSPSLHRTLWRK